LVCCAAFNDFVPTLCLWMQTKASRLFLAVDDALTTPHQSKRIPIFNEAAGKANPTFVYKSNAVAHVNLDTITLGERATTPAKRKHPPVQTGHYKQCTPTSRNAVARRANPSFMQKSNALSYVLYDTTALAKQMTPLAKRKHPPVGKSRV